MFLQCENLYLTLNRCDCSRNWNQRAVWCWTGTMRFWNAVCARGRVWQRGVSKVQPWSPDWLQSGGVYVGSRCGRKWRTVGAQPRHSHFPHTRHPQLALYKVPLFTLLQVCVCVNDYCLSVCHAGRWGSFPFALDKHFLSVNTGEPGTPQFPD